MLVFSPSKSLWVVLSRQESTSSVCIGSCLTEGKGGEHLRPISLKEHVSLQTFGSLFTLLCGMKHL